MEKSPASNDPVVIGRCFYCCMLIYSDENYNYSSNEAGARLFHVECRYDEDYEDEER